MKTVLNQSCPEIPFFGLFYPDARCIDGYLWDLDKCDEHGNLYGEGDIPCPFCNTKEFIEYDYFGILDSFLQLCSIEEPTVEQQREAEELTKEWYFKWIIKMEKRYGR